MENGAGKQYVYIRSHDEWIGAFEQNTLIAVGGWTQKQRYTEIGGVFVKEQFRRQGIGSLINSRLLAHIGNKQIVAYARPGESKILARHGFTVK
jgi:predicted GNAT family acetyltransferase